VTAATGKSATSAAKASPATPTLGITGQPGYEQERCKNEYFNLFHKLRLILL
jgi:hypothetical protein